MLARLARRVPAASAAEVAPLGAGESEPDFSQRVDACAAALHAALPHDALLVVVTQPDLAAATALERRKRACLDVRSAAIWSPELEAALQTALDAAMYGNIYVRGAGTAPPQPTEEEVEAERAAQALEAKAGTGGTAPKRAKPPRPEPAKKKARVA